MYMRVWFDDGAVSDRPCTADWDSQPAAEWPAAPELRIAVATQAFHDNGVAYCDDLPGIGEHHHERRASGRDLEPVLDSVGVTCTRVSVLI